MGTSRKRVLILFERTKNLPPRLKFVRISVIRIPPKKNWELLSLAAKPFGFRGGTSSPPQAAKCAVPVYSFSESGFGLIQEYCIYEAAL